MEIGIVIIIFFLVFLFDFIPFLKQGKEKQKWIYVSFFIVSFTILILDSLHIDVPSPTNFIKGVMDWISKLF